MTDAKQKPKVDESTEIDVISTAPGTFGPEGIAPIGTQGRVTLMGFSSAWMRPANREAAATLNAYRDQEQG